jgi:glycerol-3-phosphate acyltransferase PlsX
MVFDALKAEFTRNIFTKFAALMALRVLKAFKRRFDPRGYNGAGLLGLRGVVVKSHGSADTVGFLNALERAAEAVRNRLPERIAERMAQLPPSILNVPGA